MEFKMTVPFLEARPTYIGKRTVPWKRLISPEELDNTKVNRDVMSNSGFQCEERKRMVLAGQHVEATTG